MDIKRRDGKFDSVFMAVSPIGLNAIVEHFDRKCLVTLAVKREMGDKLEEEFKKLGLEVGR